MEQILGRVLRLPYAKAKGAEALNQAYAYVTSREFGLAAASIKDALVESGFERYEAEAAVVEDGGGGGRETSPLFSEPVAEVVTGKPSENAIAALTKAVWEKRVVRESRRHRRDGDDLDGWAAYAKAGGGTFDDFGEGPKTVGRCRRWPGRFGGEGGESGGIRGPVERAAIGYGGRVFAGRVGAFTVRMTGRWIGRWQSAMQQLRRSALDPSKTTAAGAMIDVGAGGKSGGGATDTADGADAPAGSAGTEDAGAAGSVARRRNKGFQPGDVAGAAGVLGACCGSICR